VHPQRKQQLLLFALREHEAGVLTNVWSVYWRIYAATICCSNNR